MHSARERLTTTHESISPPLGPHDPVNTPRVQTWHSVALPFTGSTNATCAGFTDANSVCSLLIGNSANLMTTVVVATTIVVKRLAKKDPWPGMKRWANRQMIDTKRKRFADLRVSTCCIVARQLRLRRKAGLCLQCSDQRSVA